MSLSTTVVISCAGIGSRLGMGMPKALIEIAGKSIIEHHLDQLKDFDDVRIVVGYEAQKVIDKVLKIRKDIIFVYNHNYRTTNTLASLCLGAKGAREYTLSIDGDLVLAPGVADRFIKHDGNLLGYCEAYTDEAVYVHLDENKKNAISFTRETGKYEWTGLVKIKSEKLKYSDAHVYQLLEMGNLPIEVEKIDCFEVDTTQDYERAITWAEDIFEGKLFES